MNNHAQEAIDEVFPRPRSTIKTSLEQLLIEFCKWHAFAPQAISESLEYCESPLNEPLVC
jgi:hypothetical protein